MKFLKTSQSWSGIDEQPESEAQKKLQRTDSDRVCDDDSHGVFDCSGSVSPVGGFRRI